jgi:hypothetical protein
MARTFEDKPATRERTPLFVGLIGPSGSGKTFSALRLASGFQRVSGGDIFFVDTEARRALHYADRFRFRHVPFGRPFGPLDYLAAVEHCVRKGAGTIIIDSMSHEHEGPGGVLEQHAQETTRLARAWKTSEDKAKFSAWNKPKTERRRLITTLTQEACNFILCFRAKPKIKPVRDDDPLELGLMPIAGEEYVYEMTVKFLLYPGSQGIPTIESDYPGERTMIKIPEQFRDYLYQSRGRNLSEDAGEYLARWAAGAAAPPKVSAAELVASYASCSEPATYRTLEDTRRANWASFKKDEKAELKAAAEAAAARMAESETTPAPPEGDDAGEPASEGDGAEPSEAQQ